MVELIVAIAILSFGVIGVYGAFSPVISLTYTIPARLTAVYLAQEGLEIARNIRDTNFIKAASNPAVTWSDGLINCGLGCQADYTTGTVAQSAQSQLQAYNDNNYLRLDYNGFYNYTAGEVVTVFKRKVTVVIPEETPNVAHIFVAIMWEYAGRPYNFLTDGFLYNWK